MTDTPNLALPYILAAQAQKHVTHNEAIRAIDCLVQLAIVSRLLAAPPVSPADGARYVVAAAATGDWSGQSDKIAAFQDGAWAFYAPREGWVAWVASEAVAIVYASGAWVVPAVPGLVTDHGALTGLADDDHTQYHTDARGDARYMPVAPTTVGVNATADATNKFALKSDASLFDNVGAGHQQKINKHAAGDTASQLYQTNYSGRAEIGLTGDDDFHFKVSPDGSAWNEGIKINKTTGDVTFPATGQILVQRFTSSGTWTKPAGAKRVQVFVTGAGGSGGGGGKAATSTAVSGGGGGGGASRRAVVIDASLVGATETVTVAAASSGGAGASVNGPGVDGAQGGNSSFGTWAVGYGGGAASGGNASTASGGGAPGNHRTAGLNASGATGGGTAGWTAAGGSGVAAVFNNGPIFGGGGGGCASTGAAASPNGAFALEGACGGAAGGGVTSANAFQAGGTNLNRFAAGTINGGTTDGAAGTAGTTFTEAPGTGGTGGAGSVSANGGAGGAGGAPGGGGGGGGGSQGGNGGVGGGGGRGEVLVVTYR